jgi:RNA polymerase sigma-70 factor (ECF subfamily)
MNWLARVLPVAAQMSDEDAMRDLQLRGDHAAFAHLVQRWQEPIRRLCTRMTGDEHRGEDLAQETFARVFTRRHQFHLDRRFSTWLWRIAINLCHEDARRNASRTFMALEEQTSASPGPDEFLGHREQCQLVRDALAELPENLRVVVILREYEGLKFREIAEVLDTPQGTVQSRMTDALERLSRKLRPKIEPRSNRESEVDAHGTSRR